MSLFAVSYALLWVLVLFLATAVFMLYRYEGRKLAGVEQRNREPGPEIGALLESFEMQDESGKSINVGGALGKSHVLAFTSSTCKHCAPRLPALRELAMGRPDLGVVVVVSGELSPDGKVEYVERLGSEIPVITDRRGGIATGWQINRFPFVMTVGPGGEVLSKGSLTNTSSLLQLVAVA